MELLNYINNNLRVNSILKNLMKSDYTLYPYDFYNPTIVTTPSHVYQEIPITELDPFLNRNHLDTLDTSNIRQGMSINGVHADSIQNQIENILRTESNDLIGQPNTSVNIERFRSRIAVSINQILSNNRF